MTSQNRLADASSPYLQQHANNPVDWWPWSDEALEVARVEKKLILLSIGYSACHWCHVMAHESFEDDATAAVMNEHYINIKVDREERPDLDKIYQTAHQMLNQRPGGWPLTMILTPDDRMPFFAGTYFPDKAKHGMPAFKEILLRVNDFYHTEYDQILQQNRSLLDALSSLENTSSNQQDINSAPLDQARRQLEQQFDKQFSGFGKAPKFPHPSNLEFLLRHWNATADEESKAKDMLLQTLHAMASGGIYDQLIGGFYRYSVDDYWMIPHFEKMLYDNGPLLSLYSNAAVAFKQPVFMRIATETANWVINEMQSPEGGYYSTLDADSEGVEGKFYVWTPNDAKNILTDEEYNIFSQVYGLDRVANFEGNWHLHIFKNPAEVAKELNIENPAELLASAKQKLYEVRDNRIKPGRDEKILTSWNALMIKGLAQAGRLLSEPRFVESAEKATDFIYQTMFKNGRLYASYKDGQARLMAYLDDYAFLLDALLELLQAKWNNDHLNFAIQLADALLEHFEDKQHGGFYYTANDHEQLIQRPKPMADEAIPSGNAIAAFALNRLGILLSEKKYIESAERAIHNAWPAVSQAPYAHAAMLFAIEESLYPPELILVSGDEKDKDHWTRSIDQDFQSRSMSFFIDTANKPEHKAIKQRLTNTGSIQAYICRGQTCLPPVTTPDELMSARKAP